MKLFNLPELLFEVEDAQTSIGDDINELSTVDQPDDVGNDVGIPVPDDVEGDEEDVETEEEPEEEEESEEEPEPEEVEEPEPEVTHPFDRPSIKAIQEAYPDIFKKFPSLKDMYFREQEFTKIFPTIDDAREAGENNQAFINIKNDILSGTGEKFLSAIKEVDEKGLVKFSRNFIPNLLKISPPAFWGMANPFIEDVARQMYDKGMKENDENLANSALWLSKWFFGDIAFAKGEKTNVVPQEEKSEVAKEREAYDQERYVAFRGSVEQDLGKSLREMIIGRDPKTEKLKIDPNDVLSQFIRDMIVDKVISDVGQQLAADKVHIRYMDSLWDRAKKNGRTDADKSRIISAYLARARAIIPTLRSKYVSEAYGRRASSEKDRQNKMTHIRNRGTGPGRPSGHRTPDFNPRNIDYSRTSDDDILNDRITYKN